MIHTYIEWALSMGVAGLATITLVIGLAIATYEYWCGR